MIAHTRKNGEVGALKYYSGKWVNVCRRVCTQSDSTSGCSICAAPCAVSTQSWPPAEGCVSRDVSGEFQSSFLLTFIRFIQMVDQHSVYEAFMIFVEMCTSEFG